MKKSIQIATLTIVTSLTASLAFAGKENYAGSDCVRSSGGTLSYGTAGQVYNTSSSSSMRVNCHVPHLDFDGFLNAGEIDSAWVDTQDRNASSAVTCRIRGASMRSNGSLQQYFGVQRSTVGFGTNRRRLNLNGSVSEDGSSNYVLSCLIPPRTNNGSSHILTYRVNH